MPLRPPPRAARVSASAARASKRADAASTSARARARRRRRAPPPPPPWPSPWPRTSPRPRASRRRARQPWLASPRRPPRLAPPLPWLTPARRRARRFLRARLSAAPPPPWTPPPRARSRHPRARLGVAREHAGGVQRRRRLRGVRARRALRLLARRDERVRVRLRLAGARLRRGGVARGVARGALEAAQELHERRLSGGVRRPRRGVRAAAARQGGLLEAHGVPRGRAHDGGRDHAARGRARRLRRLWRLR